MAKQNRSAQVLTASAEKPANPVITSSNHKCPPAGTVNITVQEVAGVTFTASVKESDKGSVQVNGTTITYTAHSPAATETANVVIKATKDSQESEAVEVPVEVVVSYITLNPDTITVEKGKQATATITTNVASISRQSADQSKVTSEGDNTQITVTGVEVSEGAVNVTLTGTADGGSEVSVQLPVTVTAPAVVTPDAPVLTQPGDKEVNESTELVIAFNNVDSATLNAEVVGGAENGTATVEGFNVKYQAPAVDADKDVVVNVTVSKDGQTSTVTAVNVKVKNVPEETRLNVTPNTVSVTAGQQSEVLTVDTDATDYTVEINPNDVASFDKGSKKFTGLKEGTATATFTATAANKTEKRVTVSVNVQAAAGTPATQLTLNPTGPISLANGSTQEVTVTTNAADYVVEGNDDSKLGVDKQAGKFVLTGKADEGSVTLTVKATADSATETSVQLVVNLTAAQAQKPAKPVLVDSQPLEVDENGTKEINFTIEEGSTLEAVVEGGNGTAEFKAGSSNTEGIITYKAPISVDSDTNVKITVTAKKNEVASEPLEVTIKVKSVLDKPQFTVNPNPINVEAEALLDVTVEGDVDTVEARSSDDLTYVVKQVEGKTIKTQALKAGNCELIVTGKKSGKSDRQVKIPVVVAAKQPTETQLEVSVSKDPIIVGDKVIVTINTNASDYTVNEFNQDVATFDKATKTITCHKEGAARFVFRATAAGLGEKTAELNIVVKQYVFLEVIPSSVTVRQNEESIDLLINTNGDVVNAVVTNEGIATYNRETKKVTGVAVGSTEITFTASKAGKVDRVVTVPVTVEEEVIYIPKLLTTNTSVVSGDTLDLRFATPQKGATLSARVENEDAGTVRVDGDTVYFESKQLDESKLALVYVKTVKDTKESAEISVPVLVTVRPKTKITIEGPSSLKIGDKYDYKVVTEASSFVIESSDPAIAAVEGDFVVPKAVGKVTITAKATAANKLEGTASIEATVTEKVKGTTPKLLTDQSRLTTERAKELVLEFQLVNGETLQGKVDPALGAINVVNNTASVYLLPDVVSDTVQMSFTALSKDNVASDALDVTINVNKLKDLNPVPVKPVATKIKIEENMSYNVLMDTALAGIKYKLFANPTEIVDVNTQTMTIIGANKGEGHITVVASSIGYDNNVINIPITVTEDPDEELPDVPENPDEPGKEEMTEQEISDLLLQKGVPVREKFDTIKKKGPAAFQAIVNKLDSYNEQMNPATSSLDSKQCANKNFELYTMIKNATNVSDNSSFNLRFDIINLYFKEYKDEAFDEFALFRADDAWTWGQNSLETYQNLITIITSLCDITTRANNIRTIDVPKTINDVDSDLTQLSKQNIIGYYAE